MELYLGLAALFAIGAYLWFDANRLAKHVQVAEALMVRGLSEEAAMEQSGCNFWDKPWYARLFVAYPSLLE
jgi:hypothetical protein